VEVFIRDRGWVTYDPTPPTAAVPQSELDGVFASLRDLFEAFSQRWSQHVIGYDLRQQIGLIESLRRREQTGPSWLRQPSKRVKIAMLGIVITVGSIFFIYRRRREQGPNKSRKKKGISKDALLASKLYSKLDQTMTAIGLGRDKSVPPMLHARKLAETDSPGAGTIRKLTQIYIDTRFGGLNLTSQQHEFFEQSIRELKNQRAVER
jgi:hypothetical protein